MPKSLAGKLSVCFTIIAFVLPALLFFYASKLPRNPADSLGLTGLGEILSGFVYGGIFAMLGFISGLFAVIKNNDRSVDILISILVSALPTLLFLGWFVVGWFH